MKEINLETRAINYRGEDYIKIHDLVEFLYEIEEEWTDSAEIKGAFDLLIKALSTAKRT